MIQEEIVKEIIDTFKEITEETVRIFTATQEAKGKGDESSKTWTRIVKEKFSELGKRKKYDIFPDHLSTQNTKEWLYDLCWRKSILKGNKNYLAEVILILESEWQKGTDVIYDFQKLLQSKAKFKIMVFEKQTKRDYNNLLREMYFNIQEFWNRDDEIYFLFQYDYNKSRIIFPVYTKTNRTFDNIMKTINLAELKETNRKYRMQNISGEKGNLDFEEEYIVTCSKGNVHKYKDIDYLVADGWVIEE